MHGASAKRQALGWGIRGVWRREPGGWGPLAPVTLLAGRCLGDDAHAGAVAAHAAAAGRTEAAPGAVAQAAAVAAAS